MERLNIFDFASGHQSRWRRGAGNLPAQNLPLRALVFVEEKVC